MDKKAPKMTDRSYQNPALSIEDRVTDLLARLTPEEKAGQLSQYFYFGGLGELPVDLDVSSLPAEHQAFVRQPKMVEEAVSAGLAGSVLFVKDAAEANRLQRMAVTGTRHGIPLIFGFDVIHGLRTIFPVPIAQAASWDPAVVEGAQSVAAKEARAVGIHWTFAPMVDIARDPRWGRIIEGAGEDPHLGSVMAAASVRGFQGHFGAANILAGPKHFAGYGAARGGRDYDDVEVSDSELNNVYLPPFKAAIDAGAKNIMSAYMDLNGVPASANGSLLTEILRAQMGFDGFVVSDANAVKSLETQHFARSAMDAAARAVGAGLDMEMCMFDPAFASLPEAVQAGLVDQAGVDLAVRRVLRAKFALGLFESPWADEIMSDEILADPAHRELSMVAAERSTVLLKNEGILPLHVHAGWGVAIVGQLADSKRDTLGPWVFAHDTSETVTIVEGIKSHLADTATVSYEPGAGIPSRLFPSMFDRQDSTVVNTPADYDDDTAISRAVQICFDADIAIVVVGERQNQIGENASKSTLDLPGRQLEQLQRIAATGTPIVLVVMSGRPLDLRWAQENVPAILMAWYPGTRGGEAVARILFGDRSPAGRLPFTWPQHVGQVPMIYSHMRTFQPESQQQRYWDDESKPLYPFGHGMSYACFKYSNLKTSPLAIDEGDSASVSVDVTNVSDVDGDEVVQLYVHQRHGRASRPIRELKGFERIALRAGETRAVLFKLGPEDLRYWSSADRGWVQDATEFDIWVGGSSATDLHTTLTVGSNQ